MAERAPAHDISLGRVGRYSVEFISYFELYRDAKVTCVSVGTGDVRRVRDREDCRVRACCYFSFDGNATFTPIHFGLVRWDSQAKAFVDVPSGTPEDNGAPAWLAFQGGTLIREVFEAFKKARDQFLPSRIHWFSRHLSTGELIYLSPEDAWATLAKEQPPGRLLSDRLVILLKGSDDELGELLKEETREA